MAVSVGVRRPKCTWRREQQIPGVLKQVCACVSAQICAGFIIEVEASMETHTDTHCHLLMRRHVSIRSVDQFLFFSHNIYFTWGERCSCPTQAVTWRQWGQSEMPLFSWWAMWQEVTQEGKWRGGEGGGKKREGIKNNGLRSEKRKKATF